MGCEPLARPVKVRLEPTLSQSLHLMNGDTVAAKVAQGNLVGKLLAEKRPPAFVIEQCFMNVEQHAMDIVQCRAKFALHCGVGWICHVTLRVVQNLWARIFAG